MSKSLSSNQYDVDDLESAIEFYFENGWTDGLPVVPPTEQNVERMIKAGGRSPQDIIGHYTTRKRVIRVEKVAINAVMAGCKPEYFPVVLALMEAMTDPAFGIHGANASTGSMALGFVINGPIRQRLGMNYRGNVFGPGNRANSTIGRALRLIQINVLGSIPGAGHAEPDKPILDRSTMGQPGKYAGYHLVENEEDFPTLAPLHVELGYEPAQSVATLFPTAGHLQISTHADHGAEATVETIVHYLIGAGKLAARFLLLALPPETVEHFVRDGWTKKDIREAIFQKGIRNVAWAKQAGWPVSGGPIDRRGGKILPGDEDKTVSLGSKPEDIYLVVAGGPAGAFVHALLPYGGLPVSKTLAD